MTIDSWKADKYEAQEAARLIGNYLNIYLPQEQGVRLGDACVVSLKAHRVEPRRKGVVRILTNRDAGQHYLDFIETGRVVNLSVYHKPAVVDPVGVARHIIQALEEYVIVENPRLNSPIAAEEKEKHVLDLAYQILVTTRGGSGMVPALLQGQVNPISEEYVGSNCVQVLAKLPREKYALVLIVAGAVEDALAEQQVELGKVRQIVHGTAKEEKKPLGPSLMIPWRKMKGLSFQAMKENQNQLIMRLAEKFGSLEELEDFLETSSKSITSLGKREQQKRKWGDIKEEINDLKELGLLKDGLLGPTLTRDGEELKKYLIKNKCELEAEMRRNIRRASGQAGRIRIVGHNTQKIVKVQITNRNKVKREDTVWSGDLAVPETVIHALKTSLLYKKGRLLIGKEDLHVYGKRPQANMDVCILMDASLSMMGEKRKAACFMAQHLLLTGHDKVAVVIFQEMRGRVMVPFTRSLAELNRGLRNIVPGGMTPLADGIVTAVDLIAENRVHNPTLLLITDGMPNFPLWTYDARKDALDAARRIPEKKIRLVCIGVEANREFLEELVDVAKGKLYVVDDLTKGSLLKVVRIERRAFNAGQEA